MPRSVFSKATVLMLSFTAFLSASAQQRWGVSVSVRPNSHFASTSVAGTTTVKHWSSSFTFHSVTYQYTLVGTNPSNGSATTTISTYVQPLKLVFSDGSIFSPPTTALVNSPIFLSAKFPTGRGQYGDVIQRANFAKLVSAKARNYHVLLGQPVLMATQTINVPAADGVTQTWNGTKVGLIDFTWLTSTINNLAIQLFTDGKLNATALPIFLVGNVFEPLGNYFYAIGYHTVIQPNSTSMLTYIYTAWNKAGLFTNGAQDMMIPSHEIAEWINDPFLTNVVPSWGNPNTPSTCASNMLEIGDPIEVYHPAYFTVMLNGKTYHPQDLAFFSWFANQVPSVGQNGRYSYATPAKLTAPPQACQ